MVYMNLKYTMTFLDNHGFMARVIYLNFNFVTMLFLSALFAGILGAPQGASEDALYESCALAGAVNGTACPTLGADDTTGQTLFDIAVLTSVVNGLLFVWSIAAHWDYGAGLIAKGQFLLSLLNVGLFAGLVGNLNSVEGILDEANVENNVFFTTAGNPYAIVVFGLSAGVLDFVLFNALNMWYFKDKCVKGSDRL